MAPRQRKPTNRPLPPNVRERDGYYTYRHPTEGTEYGIGRDKRNAIAQAIEANMRLAGEFERPRLIDRITGDGERTWGRWCDEFVKLLAKRKSAANTVRTRKSLMKRLRGMVKAGTPADKVTTLDCSTALEALENAGKQRTAQSLRTLMKDCFDRMVAKGWRPDNPAKVTDAVLVEIKRARLPFPAFMSLYKTTSVVWLRNAMALAIVSGQAREDCAFVEFADIHDGGWWNERGKTGARIFLPLELRLDCFGMSLEDVVRQCRKTGIASRYLIHQTERKKGSTVGKKMHVDMMTRVFSAELAKLGLDWGGKLPPTLHEIRSLSGRLYKEQGNVNPQELYGHKDPRTTAIYTDGRGEWVKVMVRK